MTQGGAPAFPVQFDEGQWAEDLRASTADGRRAAQQARASLEKHGAPSASLKRCGDHDGAALAGYLKLYVPIGEARGSWGLVLEPRYVPGLVLAVIAFGVRHPPAESPRWSVYARAHSRLYGGA